MTTVLPAQCFACRWLRYTPDPNTMTAVVSVCKAYPDGVPDDFVMGADHRQARGDEQNGLKFEQIDDERAHRDFDFWLSTFGNTSD